MPKQEIHITLGQLKEIIKESLGEYHRRLSLNEQVIGNYDLDWHGSEPEHYPIDGDTAEFATDIVVTIKTRSKNLPLWKALNPAIIEKTNGETIFKIKVETVLEWERYDDFDDDSGRISGWERPSRRYDDIEETYDCIERLGVNDEDCQIINVKMKRHSF